MSTPSETTLDPVPHLIIRPSSGWKLLDLGELWHYRDLLITLAERDVKLRYRQTAMGALWVVLQPLMAAGIFSFVFGSVAKLPSDGIPYFIFSYAGLLGWNAFSNTIGKASACLVGNSHLISKVYFPRLILPFSTVFSSLVDFGVAFALMLAMLAAYHISFTAAILLVPVWLSLILMFAMGVGLYVSALMVSYRDVQYIFPVLTQMLLYASPVAYAVSAVPLNCQTVYFLNPLAALLEAFRWSLLPTGGFPAQSLLYSSIASLLVFVGGAFAFKKMERKFADVI